MRQRKLLHGLLAGTNELLSWLLTAVLLAVAFFAVYMIRDLRTIVSESDSDRYAVYNPTQGDGASYAELSAINPELTAWLTLDGTSIDYPVVQGKNNQKYVNTSVLGDFSLSGAIFADARNTPGFVDELTIVYGHNMAGDKMFGGLNRYEDAEYFASHRTGTLYHDGRLDRLEVFAFFDTVSHDLEIYNPQLQKQEVTAWLDRVRGCALNLAEELPESGPILLMSTCAAGEAEGRRLLAAAILPGGESIASAAADAQTAEETEAVMQQNPEPGLAQPWRLLLCALLVLALLTALYLRGRRKTQREKTA